MSLLEAALLGLLQGLTEFLPVSSSGHIELGKAILGVTIKENVLFTVVLHFATALSTIIVYRKDIYILLKDTFKLGLNDSRKFIGLIALSCIPVGLVGVFFKDQIDTLFEGNILLVGAMLLITSLLLFLTQAKHKETNKSISIFQAILIGLAQAIAVLPGVSRSGATVSTALLLGIKRETAARFSFLMVIPPIFGVMLLELMSFYEEASHANLSGSLQPESYLIFIVGFFTAFLSGLFACKWMIALIKKVQLHYFAIYCLVAGLLAISASFW